jgi:nucleotide-binding universal stress UspA family protein
MIRIKSVLCPVDFSPVSLRALDYAIKLARHYESRLHLLHVIAPVIPSLYVDTKKVEAAIQKQVDKKMPQLRKSARSLGVEAESVVRTGEIEREIQLAAREGKADLIVVGKHARSTVDRWFMGSTTDRLLRRSAIPLLIIGESKGKRSTSPHIRRIVVTTDLSEGSETALAYALSLAQERRASLIFLHVMPPQPIAISPPLGPIVLEPRESADQIRRELENRIPADARDKCSVETRVESGEPYRQILNVVKQTRADLLVMNIHGKGGLERALLGSTAERVIRGASCPVLAIPPSRRRRAS